MGSDLVALQADVLRQQLMAADASLIARNNALSEMRAELAKIRADRDRAWARVKVMEERINAARTAIEGR